MLTTRKWRLVVACLLILSLLLVACGGTNDETSSEEEAPVVESDSGGDVDVVEEPDEGAAEEALEISDGKVVIDMWTHSAGNPNELAAIEGWIADFNAQSDQFQVVLESFPQDSYNDSIAAASIAGSLPCVIDLDAPTVPNFAWSGYIQPLGITEADVEEMGVLTNDVGRYNGEIYSLGQFDVALLIYARQTVLDEYSIRVPSLDDPWTLDEFNAALDTLKDSSEFEYALDVNAGNSGEWWPYAYSPMLQSFGGDLINRDNFTEAEGVLNGPEAVAWAEWFQNLFVDDYAAATPADDQGFNTGRVALWYTGSWAANSVLEAWGDDALFLPPPDFGNGPVIGAGSWQLGVSTACSDEAAVGAKEFVLFTMQPQQVANVSNLSSLVPTTSEGAALTENYAEGGKFRTFYDLMEAYALVRPETPGYLTISSQFEQAGLSIRDGGNVQDALDDAVDAIERDIEDNGGYGFSN
jgi:multiple sugar transport system substrate-binding protein